MAKSFYILISWAQTYPDQVNFSSLNSMRVICRFELLTTIFIGSFFTTQTLSGLSKFHATSLFVHYANTFFLLEPPWLILLRGTTVLAFKLETSPIQKFQEIDPKSHS